MHLSRTIFLRSENVSFEVYSSARSVEYTLILSTIVLAMPAAVKKSNTIGRVACLCGNLRCSGHAAPAKPLIHIENPLVGRGIVLSMNQATKGRPEFIFLDTPLNEDLMLSCSKIISNYEEEGTHPHHLELVRAIPFEDDPELCFIARFLTNHNSPRGSSRSLKTKLEAYFLCNENKHHGIIVMIPIMRQSAGCRRIAICSA